MTDPFTDTQDALFWLAFIVILIVGGLLCSEKTGDPR